MTFSLARAGIAARLRTVVLSVAVLVVATGSPCTVLGQDGPEEGVRGQVRPSSKLAQLVPVESFERRMEEAYHKKMREAAAANRLGPDNHTQVVRLRAIAARIIPFATSWNPRAAGWRWEINLIAEDQINATCMAGGKIVFYTRLLSEMQLSDDEVAVIMGHEVAHALREHSRKGMAEGLAVKLGANVIGSVLGVRETGGRVLDYGAHLVSLKFGRSEELEADLIGLELAARAGYDPASGVGLWQKMSAGGRGGPEYKSTHPSGERRIQQIQEMLPRVQGLYERAEKPPRVFGPPPRS